MRDKFIKIRVTEQEKQLIRKNATLHDYKAVAPFLRDLGLSIDMSAKKNSTFLALLFKYLEKYSPDRALTWVRKQQRNLLKINAMTKFAGMPREKYLKTLSRLEKSMDDSLELKKELNEILAKRLIAFDVD